MIVSERLLHGSKNLIVPTPRFLPTLGRLFNTSSKYLTNENKTDKTRINPISNSAALQEAPRAYGKNIDEYTPQTLDYPLGLPKPPIPGENNGIDMRTWRQRRNDFLDYDKHLLRRRQLTVRMATPYFREWNNMRFSKGKSFLAPPRLFRRDKALYFPNFFGQTLRKDRKKSDTTPILKEKISVLCAYSSVWGENQASSFVSENQNPELHEIMRNSKGLVQIVQINFEANSLKAMLVKIFMRSLRKKLDEDSWGKYFLVQKGLSMEIRDRIGLLNSKVGYVYLVDKECKIRWAGCGFCESGEKISLLKGVKRLIEDTVNSVSALQM